MTAITKQQKAVEDFFKNITDQEALMAWALENYPPFSAGYYPATIQQVRTLLILINKNNSDYENKIMRLNETFIVNLIPDDKISWINKTNFRQLIFIFFKITMQFNFRNLRLIPIHIQELDSLLSTNHDFYFTLLTRLNACNIDLSLKLQILNIVQSEWFIFQQEIPNYRWLKLNDETQINWTFEYLFKNNRFLNFDYTPESTSEIYQFIEASLDNFNYQHPSEKILFIDKMKKTWSQKKFRDSGKAKKLYQLPLTDTASKYLKRISEIEVKKQYEILEILIKEKADQLKALGHNFD